MSCFIIKTKTPKLDKEPIFSGGFLHGTVRSPISRIVNYVIKEIGEM